MTKFKKICKNCNTVFQTYNNTRIFCCRSCAATYNNCHRTTTTKGKTKLVKCNKCGKDLLVSVHSNKNTRICLDCKNLKVIKQVNTTTGKTYKRLVPEIPAVKKCRVCGSYECINSFCKGGNGRIMRHLYSLIQFGLDEKSIGTPRIFEEYNKIRNKLYDLYINQKLSTVEIAKKFNYKYNAAHILYVFDIPLRNHSTSLIISNLEGRCNHIYKSNHYKSQWYTTWNNKEVYLHSGYELDYAKNLDEQQIDYDVEFLRIKYFDTQQKIYRCAIPDFFIPSTNTVVEVKSNFTLDVQNMKDKFKAYQELGYNTKLILEHKEVNLDLL